METRIVTIVGCLFSALVATRLATMFYANLVSLGARAYFAEPGVWWWIGIPFAFSNGVAAFVVSRRNAWLPTRWTLASLALSALRITVTAVLICGAVMPLLGLVAVLALAGVPIHGSSGRGVPTDVGVVVLVVQLAASYVGVMMVLLLARWVATRIERESRSIEEWKKTY